MISQITERPLVNCVLFADYLLECADDEFDRAFCCADNEILDADDEVDYPAVTERGGDDRACVAYRAADGAFLVLRAVLKLCGFLIGLPDIGVSRYIGLVAALALMPVVGAVILPFCTVAVGMVKVVVALVASARVTLPPSTTHLSKTLPVSGASAVTVTTVFGLILSVMGVPAVTEAVPLMTVTVYSVAAEFLTNLVSPQSARWQV